MGENDRGQRRTQVSEERKMVYYVGGGIQVLGGLCFFIAFISFIVNFGNFNNFELKAKIFGGLAFGGIVLLGVGAFVRNIGAMGAAGSGVILDPEQARKDVEPYSRMTGGVIKDTLDEADIHIGNKPAEPQAPQVKVRCRECKALNDEDALFCKACGKEL